MLPVSRRSSDGDSSHTLSGSCIYRSYLLGVDECMVLTKRCSQPAGPTRLPSSQQITVEATFPGQPGPVAGLIKFLCEPRKSDRRSERHGHVVIRDERQRRLDPPWCWSLYCPRESLIQVPQTQSAFHPRAQRNASHHRGGRQQSRSFASKNRRLRHNPSSNRLC
jgi:hypothetical protein